MSWKSITYLKRFPKKLGSPFELSKLNNLYLFCCGNECNLEARKWAFKKEKYSKNTISDIVVWQNYVANTHY